MRTLVACLLLALAACAPKAPAPEAPPARAADGASRPRAAAPAALHVDHAWVRDADTPAEQAARRQAIETLRTKVQGGESFVAVWTSLGVDAGPWHVADGETYPYDVVPAEARDLPVGQLSTVIPGNGGLHLFRITGQEPAE
jgi:hypothetical protein